MGDERILICILPGMNRQWRKPTGNTAATASAHIPPGKPENNATGPDVVAFWLAICYNSQKRGEKVSL